MGALLLSCAALTELVHATGPIELELQAADGQTPSGFSEDSFLTGIREPYFNGQGQVVFAANLVDPGPGLLSSRQGIFLREGGEIRKIVLGGEVLPGGEYTFTSYGHFTINNSGNMVVLIPSQGILLSRLGSLQWLVKAGDPAAEVAAGFDQFEDFPSGTATDNPAFFDDSDQILFRATLSNGSAGVFLAAPRSLLKIAVGGDPIPGSTLTFVAEELAESTVMLKGDWVLIRTASGIFRFSLATGLETVALRGAGLVEGGAAVQVLGDARINSSGTVAFVAALEELPSTVFHWSPAGAVPAAKAGNPFPGFPGHDPDLLRLVTLDDQGRLLLVAQTASIAGIYLWKNGQLEKIVVDGDPTPLGGSFVVGLSPVIYIFLPTLYVSLTQMNDSLEFAFQARIRGRGSETTTFIWRNGILQPIILDNEIQPGLGERLLSSLTPRRMNARGTLLLSGSQCCRGGNSVFVATPASARTIFLPFLAVGEDGPLRFNTRIDYFNHSPFSSFVEIDVFDSQGETLRVRTALLGGGGNSSFSLSYQTFDDLTTGYVRFRVEGGAKISARALIQALSSTGLVATELLSQTNIEDSTAAFEGAVLVGVSPEANTGVALTNPGADDSDYELRLKDAGGQDIWSGTILLSAAHQRSLFVTELVPELPVPFQGLLEVRGSNGFLLTGIRQSDLQLSTLPVGEPAGPVADRSRSFSGFFPEIPPQYPGDPWEPNPWNRCWSPTTAASLWRPPTPSGCSRRESRPGSWIPTRFCPASGP